jgi:peptidoglycan L-alanyl-D-glutamate endopeptidase CwlK
MKDAALVEQVAIAWGGDWKTFKDGPHFELTRKKYP